MPSTLDQVCCASLDPTELAVLADLRAESDIRVTVVAGRAWVRWHSGDDEVLRRVLPVRGVELFANVDGRWYRPGHHLPCFTVPAQPADDWMPLSRAIVPSAVGATPPAPGGLRPVRLGLARDGVPRAATALRCRLADLAAWAEHAPSARLSSVRAAVADGAVFLHGRRLPELAAGERFWGDDVFLPLGFRAEPDLSAAAIRAVLRAAASDVLVLAQGGFEAIPSEAFRPVTRAGLRLALGGRAQ